MCKCLSLMAEDKAPKRTLLVNHPLFKETGEFTWVCGTSVSFIKTRIGNYTWSDSTFGGTDIISKYNGSINKYFRNRIGRNDGTGLIKEICWRNDIIVEE